MKSYDRLPRSALLLAMMTCCSAAAEKGHDATREGTPQAPAARTIAYGERDVVPVQARLRYTTLLILPKQEQILDYVCGDKEFWVVNGNQNFAYVKPAKSGARTNLNLITAAGNVYSFVLTEVGERQEPDFKLFIEPKDESLLNAIGRKRLFTTDEVDQFRQRAEAAEKQMQAVRTETAEERRHIQTQADEKISRARAEAPQKLQFPYQWKRNERPFLVSSIYHDGSFTYIKADPEETPALYEVKDGKPNLIQYDYRNGVYFVPKVLDSGYLEIGKKKLPFYRKD